LIRAVGTTIYSKSILLTEFVIALQNAFDDFPLNFDL